MASSPHGTRLPATLPFLLLASLLAASASLAAQALAAQGGAPPTAGTRAARSAARLPELPERLAPSGTELAGRGWQPVEGAGPEGADFELVQPELGVGRAAALLGRQPELLPRLEARRGLRRFPLPLAAHAKLLRRDVTGSEPRMAWNVQAELLDLGEGITAARIDVPPFEPRFGQARQDVQAAFHQAERQLSREVRRTQARAAVDPGRRFRMESSLVDEDFEVPGTVRVEVLAAPVAEDCLLVTADDGETWLRLSLAASEEAGGQGATHVLGPSQLFGLRLAGRRTLLVAPAPLIPDARFDLQALDLERLELRELPAPEPVAAGWHLELAALRTRGEELEAFVLVHDPATRRDVAQVPADSWAARLAFDGRWRDLERIPFAGDGRLLRFRFAAAAPEEIEALADDRVIARWIPAPGAEGRSAPR